MDVTNYPDDVTRKVDAEDEATQFAENESSQISEKVAAPSETKAKSVKSSVKKAAVGAGAGLLIGGISTLFMGMRQADAESDEAEAKEDPTDQEMNQMDLVDDTLQIAEASNEDLSFNEAFQAARAEVGPGGVFTWHGNLYGTYTMEEWDNLTSDEKAEYASRIHWDNIDSTESDVAEFAPETTDADEISSEEVTVAEPTYDDEEDDDIEVISVQHDDEVVVDEYQGEPILTDEDNVTVTTEEEVEVVEGETEVEILGVVHDDATGANIGGMSIGGEEAILVDMDGDMAFDYMGVDTNGNGVVEAEELVDIQDHNISVSTFDALATPSDDMLASNDDMPDYSVEADV